MRKKDVDEIDFKMINLLAEDAGITNRQLAEQLGLSDSPTLARYKNLFRKGILTGIKAKVNEGYFGYKQSWTGLYVLHGALPIFLPAKLKAIPLVKRIAVLSGKNVGNTTFLLIEYGSKEGSENKEADAITDLVLPYLVFSHHFEIQEEMLHREIILPH